MKIKLHGLQFSSGIINNARAATLSGLSSADECAFLFQDVFFSNLRLERTGRMLQSRRNTHARWLKPQKLAQRCVK
jgi:hypothetical protein